MRTEGQNQTGIHQSLLSGRKTEHGVEGERRYASWILILEVSLTLWLLLRLLLLKTTLVGTREWPWPLRRLAWWWWWWRQ